MVTRDRRRVEASSNPPFGGAAWRHAQDNPLRAPSAPQPQWTQKLHWQAPCIVRPVPCSRSKLTWLFGSMVAGQGQPASFDFARPQHANVPCTRRVFQMPLRRAEIVVGSRSDAKTLLRFNVTSRVRHETQLKQFLPSTKPCFLRPV